VRIGIDVGATKIAMGLVDGSGRIISRRRILTESRRGYGPIRDRILAEIDGILGESGLSGGDVERIGVAAAGQVRGDMILFSPNLRWENAPLKADLERATAIETFLENDVNAATYGEWKFGLAQGGVHAVGIFIGTGVGGGLIFDGRLYRGFSGVAGELGHITLNPRGYRCNCGSTGCFEAYCGGAYVVDRVKKRIEEGYKGKVWDLIAGRPEELHAGHIEAAYLEGDEVCTAVWKEVIEYLGIALQNLVNLLNPEVIICGGGVIGGTRQLMEEARGVMEGRALAPSLAGLRLEKATLGEDAVILGVTSME
jgi:glucokinase